MIIRRNPVKLSYGLDYSYSVKGHWQYQRHEHKKSRSQWTPVKLLYVYDDGSMSIFHPLTQGDHILEPEWNDGQWMEYFSTKAELEVYLKQRNTIPEQPKKTDFNLLCMLSDPNFLEIG